ncbi:MAG: CBS domain-containing protein [Egibacteraceae bacterium]
MRHVPVVDDDTVVGMVSDRDVLLRDRELVDGLNRLHSDFADGRHRRVEDVMSAPVVSVAASTTAAAAAAMLRREHISALAVLEDGRLVGIATTTDLLGAVIDEDPVAPPAPGHPSHVGRGAGTPTPASRSGPGTPGRGAHRIFRAPW